MTNPTPHGQVPEALRLAEQYDHGDPAAHGNAWKAAVCTELRRLAELEAQIKALSGVQALSAAPTIAKLRHLYQNMVNGAVRDTASAKRIAEGLLAPAIEALERATPPAEQTFITPETGNSASAKGAAITSESGTPPAEQQASATEVALVGAYARLPDFDSGDEPIWEAVFKWKAANPGSDASKKAMAVEGAIIKSLRDFADRTHALRMEQAAPKAEPGVGNSGFDYKTAADFLNGKTVSDEAVRKFVQASRWAHDEKAALSATLLAMHGVLASREAEIALLKKALLEAEAAPQPAPDCHHRPPCDECAAIAAQGGKT